MSPLIDPVTNPAFAGDIAAVSRIKVVPQVLEVVCRTTGLGFSAVARVTESHWVSCAVRDEIELGLKPGVAFQVEATFCDKTRQSGRCIAIDHVEQEADLREHPASKIYGFQSFISAPIRLHDGRFFGTLCANGLRATHVNAPETIGMFTLFAELIGQHLDLQERIRVSEASLMSERESAELREQVIAILGHDIRNPLSAINGGVEVLRMGPGKEDTAHVLDIIQKSTTRLTGLIGDVLDFVRVAPEKL